MSSTAALILALAATFAGSALAKGQIVERSWNQLGREVQSTWTMRITLVDGTIMEGRFAQFSAEGLTMRVEKSRGPQRRSKGPVFIPRQEVKAQDIRTNQPVGRAVDRRFQHLQLVQ